MLNTIALMGRLVADPKERTTPTGITTCTFTIACERNYAPKGQERQTDFFDIVTWRGTALFVCKYFTKGQLIAINGSLQTRSYEDKNGIKRKVHEILAQNVNFAGDKPKAQAQQKQQSEQAAYNPLPKQNNYSQDDFNDDYPQQTDFRDYNVPDEDAYTFPVSDDDVPF